MKTMEVKSIPLQAEDREQFILDSQWAFQYGAQQEFGMRDGHQHGPAVPEEEEGNWNMDDEMFGPVKGNYWGSDDYSSVAVGFFKIFSASLMAKMAMGIAKTITTISTGTLLMTGIISWTAILHNPQMTGNNCRLQMPGKRRTTHKWGWKLS